MSSIGDNRRLEGTVMNKDSVSTLQNLLGDEFEIGLLLAAILEKRTGKQGWFKVVPFQEYQSPEYPGTLGKVLGYGDWARDLWKLFTNLPEWRALLAIDHYTNIVPDLSGFDCGEETKRAMRGLYWTRRSHLYSPGKEYDECLANAKRELSNNQFVVCGNCHHSIQISDEPTLPLPKREDFRPLIEDLVDKHLARLLLGLE